MVRIQKIITDKKSACICLDNGDKYWLRPEDIAAAGFKEDQEYESSNFDHWIKVCQYPRALNLAVAMLARRPCSEEEIRKRIICCRHTEEIADLVIYKLEKENLLNDKIFCEHWIHYRQQKGYGSSVIRRELIMKGVSEETVCQFLSSIDPDEEKDTAVVLARKVWKRLKPDEDVRKNRQKVVLFLVRKGFDWSTAKTACRIAENE